MAKAKKKTLREALDETTTELVKLREESERHLMALNSIHNFADDQYKDGVCLRCPDDNRNGDTHSTENPGCWAKELDRILCLY